MAIDKKTYKMSVRLFVGTVAFLFYVNANIVEADTLRRDVTPRRNVGNPPKVTTTSPSVRQEPQPKISYGSSPTDYSVR